MQSRAHLHEGADRVRSDRNRGPASASLVKCPSGSSQPWAMLPAGRGPRNKDVLAQSRCPCPGDQMPPSPHPRPSFHHRKFTAQAPSTFKPHPTPTPAPRCPGGQLPRAEGERLPSPRVDGHRGLKHFLKEELRSVVSMGVAEKRGISAVTSPPQGCRGREGASTGGVGTGFASF